MMGGLYVSQILLIAQLNRQGLVWLGWVDTPPAKIVKSQSEHASMGIFGKIIHIATAD